MNLQRPFVRLVGRQQQLEAGVGALEAPGGVDARREPEADGADVDPRRVQSPNPRRTSTCATT